MELDDKIEDDREEDGCDKSERNVDQCKSQRFNKGVVHRRHRMPMHNGSLCKQGGDLVHRKQSGDEDGAVVIVLEDV